MQTVEWQEPKMIRTSCECDKCKSYCTFAPGMLTPTDLIRLFGEFPYDTLMAFALDNLLASPGALVGHMDGRIVRIPTLVPGTDQDGSCQWFTQEGKCLVHHVKPSGCAYFDHTQSPDEQKAISAILHDRIMDEWVNQPTSYTTVWFALFDAGRIAPPIELLATLEKLRTIPKPANLH